MKILIFGGTGAMGAPLVRMLAERGEQVFVTSRRARVSGNIRYIQGDAHDMAFLAETVKGGYDAIIDFMCYGVREFAERVELLLSAAKQYIFISSCRVYAPSDGRMTEESPRLYDVCRDEAYRSTEEYALAKAQQEDILKESGRRNWTIVRPGLTYNSHRLQLGSYELEQWLYRLLHGRTLVFSKDLMEYRTPMTFGNDTARALAALAGNQNALGETVHIVTPETMKWSDILMVYLDTLQNVRGGVQPRIHLVSNAEETAEILGRKWRLKYATLLDRSFSSAKIDAVCGKKIVYTPMAEGLRACLTEFLEGDRTFGPINWINEAFQDKITGERTPLSEIPSFKKKMKYAIGRYTPYFAVRRFMRSVKRA